MNPRGICMTRSYHDTVLRGHAAGEYLALSLETFPFINTLESERCRVVSCYAEQRLESW